MTTRRTILDTIDESPDGILEVRFRKEVLLDGGVIGFEYHRTTVVPGQSVAALMPVINAHLTDMGDGVVDAANIGQLVSEAATRHTPGKIVAWQAKETARRAQE